MGVRGGLASRGDGTLYLAKINVCVSVERSQRKMPPGSVAVSWLPSLVLAASANVPGDGLQIRAPSPRAVRCF